MCPLYPQICTRYISIIITCIYFGKGKKASIISLCNCAKRPCYGFHEAEPFRARHLKKSNIICCLEQMLCIAAPHLHIFDVTNRKRQNCFSENRHQMMQKYTNSPLNVGFVWISRQRKSLTTEALFYFVVPSLRCLCLNGNFFLNAMHSVVPNEGH